MRRYRRGFTLLEVLVALGLLVLAALLGEQMLWGARQALEDAKARAAALQLADATLERLRSRYSAGQAPCRTGPVEDAQSEEAANGRTYRVGWQVHASCPPILYRIDVTVSWQVGGAARSLQLIAESGDAGWR